MSAVDYSIQQQSQLDAGGDAGGSPENHCPYLPKYSRKDESALRRVDLTNLESINAVFFPEVHSNGREAWITVPKHILGIDTDFAFVSKKIEEFSKWNPMAQMQELARWDKMQRWERNMYEDRIAILMQQKALMSSASSSTVNQKLSSLNAGGVLMSRVTGHKRNREFQVAAMTPSKKTTKSAVSEGLLGGLSEAVSPTSAFMAQASNMVVSYSEIPDSKHRCVRLKSPIPSRYQGNMEADKDIVVPEFVSLMNFPALSLPDSLRCCVMCGKGCPTAAVVKSKKSRVGSKSNSDVAFIPTQNKGLCTLCDVNVWVIASSGMEIKWCKGCKNFRCWASFGEKGHATKCLRCRERQREKYAAQKEEKAKSIRDMILRGNK